VIAAALVAAAGSAPGGASTELSVPGRSNANPSIAARGRFVAIAWGATASEGPTDVYAATSRDGGRTFGSPARVNDVAGEARLSGEQPPQVTLVPRAGHDPAIVVVWTAKATDGTRLLSARSNDGGKSFTRAAALPGTDAPGNRGWEATAIDRDGRVVAIWLDHRELAKGAAPMSHAEHQHTAKAAQQTDGVARAQLSKLFFARLDGPESARELTGGVCYCCKTTMAAGADGSIYAAWRHVYPGNIRDIAFTLSRDGGRTFAPPTRVSEDRWVLDGCPENGPAMAVDGTGRVHVVWPTLVAGATPGSEPTLALYYAMSRDGRQFTPRQRIPTEGFPRHPQIALGSRGSIAVTWDEQASGSRLIALGRGTADDNGAVRFARQAVSSDGRATYPAVASTDDDVVLAWASGPTGQTIIQTAFLKH
jgi:hypothetical protein